MNDLLVIAFPTEQKAEEVRQKLFELQKEYLIEMGDAVVAVKHEDGKIKLNQVFNTTAAGGCFRSLLGPSCWHSVRAALGGRRDRRRVRRARRLLGRLRHQ